jgi:hypothetical protein
MPPKTRPNKAPSGKVGSGKFGRQAGAFDAFFASPRNQRRLLIVSLVVFAAGAVAATVAFFPGTSNAFKSTFSTVPAKLYHQPKAVKPDPTALQLARKFIQTAVERRDLDASYNIVHPDIRGRLTRKEWDTGNIPVIDYPAENAKTASFLVDYSYPTQMLLEVDLVAKPGSGVRPHLLFFIGLKRKADKTSGRWLVNYWQPHWRPPVPAGH